MEGVGGLAYINTILIFIDPMNYSEDILSYMVAHEYHHTMYFELSYRHNNKFLGSIITEGQADTFAEIVYPETKAPWTEALTQDKEKFVWNTMVDLLNKSIAIVNVTADFVSGDYNLGIPLWSNYKIGYQIMQDFIKNNPDVSIEEWTKMWATDILELSRFEERFGD